MEKARKVEKLADIAEKYYKKLAMDVAVDGKINIAEVVSVLIIVVHKSFGFILKNHGLKYTMILFSRFISKVTDWMADGIESNDGADRTESRTVSIERGDC